MQEIDRPAPPTNSGAPSAYSHPGLHATPGLAAGLAEKIRISGPIGFPDFMAAALYDPAEGYYARSGNRVGQAGDFFTSVSTGPVFGRLLARHIARWHGEIGSPTRWRILEVGANDGSLAADILGQFEDLPGPHPEYGIIEPLPAVAEIQRRRVPGAVIHPDATTFTADPLPTYVLGNEVIDALPFHVVESDGEGWVELGISLDSEGNFAWEPLGNIAMPIPPLPAGYRTELRSGVRPFLSTLAGTMTGGRMLWIDYGYPRDDYYHPDRTTGTLRTFSAHRAAEDPLATPGEIDITAHVDFTALGDDLESLGGRVLRHEPQGRFLTHIARPWLLELEGRTDEAVKKDLRAFQTLTHPGHLGSRFHVMEAEFA